MGYRVVVETTGASILFTDKYEAYQYAQDICERLEDRDAAAVTEIETDAI